MTHPQKRAPHWVSWAHRRGYDLHFKQLHVFPPPQVTGHGREARCVMHTYVHTLDANTRFFAVRTRAHVPNFDCQLWMVDWLDALSVSTHAFSHACCHCYRCMQHSAGLTRPNKMACWQYKVALHAKQLHTLQSSCIPESVAESLEGGKAHATQPCWAVVCSCCRRVLEGGQHKRRSAEIQ
jgi:hypothetical protein